MRGAVSRIITQPCSNRYISIFNMVEQMKSHLTQQPLREYRIFVAFIIINTNPFKPSGVSFTLDNHLLTIFQGFDFL